MENGNEEQVLAYNTFIDNIKLFQADQPFETLFSLIGSAGTGKTWWTAKVIGTLIEMGIKVAMTTPTHKALSVVEDMLLENGINPECCDTSTIHSFLNLKLDYGFGDDGNADNVSTKPKLKINKFNECLNYVDVLLIDESSMISEDLHNVAMSALGDRTKIILYIGDQYQLKPVEGGENIIYNNQDFIHMALTKTVRQKEGSDIIKKANELVNMIKSKQYPVSLEGMFQQSDHFDLVSHNDFLPNYFECDQNKIVGSFTNEIVDKYNNYIRYIEKNVLEYLVEGDEIIFQKPYSNAKGEVLFQNGQQVLLERVKLTQDQTNGLWYWRCKANRQMISVLDPSSKDAYKLKLDQLAESAKKAQGFDRSKAWKAFFKLQTKYGEIKYPFASTLHKLQGSTCGVIYFDMRNLPYFYSKDPDNVLRLIYVAITRPTEKVVILT